MPDNDTVVTPTLSSKYVQAESGNLYILNIANEDEGSYQCVASNPVTNAIRTSTEAHLSVVGKRNYRCMLVISKNHCRHCSTDNLL